MAKIDVVATVGADSNSIVADIVAAATAGLQPTSPGNSANPAQVIRDENGKVIKVVVAIPDGDAPGLANAKLKVEENSGVSSASSFPLTTGVIDFDSWPAATTGSLTRGDLVLLNQRLNKHAAVGNPLASGITPQNGNGDVDVQIGLNLPKLQGGIGACSIAMDIGLDNLTGTFGSPRLPGTVVVRISGFPTVTVARFSSSDANWQLPGGSAAGDTGVVLDEGITYLPMLFTRNGDGDFIITSGASTLTIVNPLLTQVSSIGIGVSDSDDDNEQDSPVIDNLNFTINS